MEIAVVGTSEFALGFRLVGIRDITEVDPDSENAADKINAAMAKESIGIIITDEKTMGSLDERTRENVEKSVKPVTVVVSTEATAQEALRKMIIKSIGVDLWGAD